MATEPSAYTIGLTGGIGSGKSVVAAQFERLGAALVDADAIAHRVTAPGGAAIEAIRARFGASVIDASGALARKKMRARAFSDPEERRALEAIVHPLVRSQAMAEAADAAARAPYVVLSIPLLIESGDWPTRVDRVLVIDCPRDVQIRRVVQRSGLQESEVAAIIAQQADRPARLRAAHDVLVNAGAIDLLPARVARLHAAYLMHARERARRSGL